MASLISKEQSPSASVFMITLSPSTSQVMVLITPDMLRDAADLVLDVSYDGEYGQAFLDGKLISDHYYGRHLVWEIGLAAWSRRAGAERLALRIPGGRNCEIRTRVLRKYEFVLREPDGALRNAVSRKQLQEEKA